MDREKVDAPYPLRMASEMRKQLKTEAAENGRSLHSEIIQRLKESLRNGGVKREEAMQ